MLNLSGTSRAVRGLYEFPLPVHSGSGGALVCFQSYLQVRVFSIIEAWLPTFFQLTEQVVSPVGICL